MEKNRSGRAGKKIKTLIIVKGNLKKVNFVTFHIIVKHKLFVIDKILPHDHKIFSPKKTNETRESRFFYRRKL